jgi:PAS domain S-box-containing protein
MPLDILPMRNVMRSSSWLRGLTARMLVCSAALLVAFAVVFALLNGALRDLDGKSRWATHSMNVLAVSGKTQNSISDMTTAALTYVEQGDQAARARWATSRDQVLSSTAALERMVGDNPTQLRSAKTIHDGATMLIDDWATPYVQMTDRGERALAARLTVKDSPRGRVSALRAEFEAFNHREELLGGGRARAAHEHASSASALVLAAFVGLVAVLLLLLWTVSRSIVNPVRRMAHASRRLALGDLEARVDEGGSTEVGDLARAFNYMVGSIRGTRESLETQNAELEAQQLALERALDGIAEQKQRVDRLHRFGESLARETRLELLAQIVLSQFSDFIGAEVGTLYALDGERDAAMALLASTGLDTDVLSEELLPGEGMAGRAVVERRMITALFGEGGLHMTSLGRELVLAREMHVPLMQGDQTVGVVTLGTSGAEDLTQAQLEQLAYLAGQAAVALSNSIALRSARTQATINRAVLESTREAFVAFDENGRITSWNPAAEWIFGRSRLEAIGLDMYDTVIPARDRDFHRKGLVRFIETGDPNGFDQRTEVTLMRRDGVEFPAVVNMSQLEVGGRRVFNVFLHDVSQEKRAERYTHAQYEVSRALAESGTMETAGPRVLSAMGEGFGWQFGTLWVVEDEQDAVLEREAIWASDGLGAQACETHDHKLAKRACRTGQLTWITDVDHEACRDCARARGAGLRRAIAVPLSAGGGVAGAMVFYAREMPDSDDRELSSAVSAIGLQVGQYVERKRAQRAADRMKDGFLALVSHELRTPLTSIVGYLELLVEDEADEVSPTGRQFLSVIDRNARRLQRLVDDVLFAAQAEAGRLSLDPRRIDLAEVASESVEALRPTAVERGIELSLEPKRLPVVTADRDRVGQAIDNLVSNALKFTPPGGSVDVRLSGHDGVAVVEVSDTGLGMSEEDRARVFDRFFRAGASRDSAPGVGLGLTIVKAIAEGHGGSVSVESEEGVGTKFRIELPLESSRAASPSRR